MRRPFATILCFATIGLAAIAASQQAAPRGTITGVVLNEFRQPMPDVRVESWMRGKDGELQLIHGALSDASGVYRFDVPPGDHYVVARVWHDSIQQGPADPPPSPCSPPPPPPPIGFVGPPRSTPNPRPTKPARAEGEWFSSLPRWIPQPSPDDSGRPRTIPTTFHPGTSNIESATVVRLAAGVERSGIDLQLNPVPVTTVRGRIVSGRNLSKGSAVRLRLPASPSEPDDLSEHQTWVGPDNTFRFVDVPPGLYVLDVQVQEAASCDVILRNIGDAPTRIRLDVPANGLDNLEIELAKGVTARGEIVFQGASDRPGEGLMDIWFLPAGSDRSVPGGWESREFSSGHLPDGRYVLEVAPNGKSPWVVRAMTFGAVDLTVSPLDVAGTDIYGIHVVMTDRPSSLDGRVVDRFGDEVRGDTVVAFPANRTAWPMAHERLLRFQTTPAKTGTFRFVHLPAGEYVVAVIDAFAKERWPTAALLEELAKGAQLIKLVEGESKTITVRTR